LFNFIFKLSALHQCAGHVLVSAVVVAAAAAVVVVVVVVSAAAAAVAVAVAVAAVVSAVASVAPAAAAAAFVEDAAVLAASAVLAWPAFRLRVPNDVSELLGRVPFFGVRCERLCANPYDDPCANDDPK